MEKFRVYGASSPEVSQREIAHMKLARKAAAEGFVLLENNGVLPLQPGKIALYGPGSRRTVKGGSGSGEVHERQSVSIERGLRNAGFLFPSTLWMDRFEEKYQQDIACWKADVESKIKGFMPWNVMQMFDVIHAHPKPFPACAPIREDELTDETDTAIYVLSRQAGEGKDRKVEPGDYLFSDVEVESLRMLSRYYEKLILILNCGSIVDLTVLDEIRIDAVIFYAQGGMAGGDALADVLTGSVNPSGKLTDTWAYRYEDYPAADTFSYRNGDLSNEEYSEGIHVGYRWFGTRNIKPRYSFGFGLSYTTFDIQMVSFQTDATAVTVIAKVTNTGESAGREVVQLYLEKPGDVIDCEKRSLAAFCKSKLLAPDESQEVTLSFDLKELASFDEGRSAFVLPRGEYRLHLGNSCETSALCASLVQDTEQVVETVMPIGSNQPLEHGSYTRSEKIASIMGKLTDDEKLMLVTGNGYPTVSFNNINGAVGNTTNKLIKKGIPNIAFSDGPAGLNLMPSICIMKDGSPRYIGGLPEDWQWGWLKKWGKFVEAKPGKGRSLYRYMTAWPSETLLAQSWDIDLLEQVGKAVGTEMLEVGVSVWLAPGMNIHRNPLCGRNFEYYSEDPYVSGKMAAAITRGIQSMGGVGVCLKHFCCNNQEDNRNEVSENVSQRALREIYLRGFRIAITESKPWTVMSPYNRVNGVHVCNSPDFLTRVLRQEWGFDGLVMSDWNATDHASHVAAINAGNDIIMPGNQGVRNALKQGLKDGTLDRTALDLSVSRLLELIFKSAVSEGF